MTQNPPRKKNERPGPAGFLVVDKPQDWTSHDVVNVVRGLFGTRRVGHLGTLDPQATGVLPLALREATKLLPFFERSGKIYSGTIVLGEETDTYDADGEIVRRFEEPLPSTELVRKVLTDFVGDIGQVPPMYSAVKRDGVPLYRLAREGIEVDREPRAVRIERIDVLRYEPPELEIELACSAGTYVRSLAHDLGERLGCGAHLKSLRRTWSAPFGLVQAHSIDDLRAAAARSEPLERFLIPAREALGYPIARLTPDQLQAIGFGRQVHAPVSQVRAEPGERVAAEDGEGQLVAVLEMRPGRMLKILRVLRPPQT